MSMLKLIKDYNTYAVFMVMFIILTMMVAKANYHNGRLDMCSEEGKFYTPNGECQSCLETGRIFLNGECVQRQPEDPIDRFIRQAYGEPNGTIL